jgi:integrase
VSTTTRTGIDRHQGAYRLRMQFGSQRHTRAGLTLEQAEDLRTEWRKLRRQGLPPNLAPAELTLGTAAAALMHRKRTQPSRHSKAMLTPRGLEHWARALRPWSSGALADLPCSMLTRAMVEDWYYARAARPVAAANELEALKAILRLARDRRTTIDDTVLSLEPVGHQHRELEPFTIGELEQIAFSAVGYACRAILVAGTTGMRWGEFTGLLDSEVDLAAATITLEAERTKERRRKVIDLTPEEVQLLAEQLEGPVRGVTTSPTGHLPGRPAGTALVFPTKTGQPWRHWQWLRFCWYPARARAADAWRLERDLDIEAPTPYDGRRPHDLRATAVTLMLDAGMSPADVATRIGHADGGALIAARYDRDMERRRLRTQTALHLHAGLGLRSRAGDPARNAADA